MTSKAKERDEPKFFKTAGAWRKWLEKNHDRAPEIWVGLHKKDSGLPSVTYKEAVDQALCFGWIDGIARGIDQKSYKQRFTPRTKRSAWSAINIARIGELKEHGLLHPAGLAAFEQRDQARTNQYSFEQEKIRFTNADERSFRGNKKAWAFFESQPPGYRKQATWWVLSAKRDETRQKRLTTLIDDSAAGQRIKPLRPAAKTGR